MRGGYAMIQITNTPGGSIDASGAFGGYRSAYETLCASVTSTFKPVYLAPFMYEGLIFGGCFVTPFRTDDGRGGLAMGFNVFATSTVSDEVQSTVTGLAVKVTETGYITASKIQTA